MSQPSDIGPPPSDPESLPTLSPEIVSDDEALAEQVDELVRRDPVARQQLGEVSSYQEMLRGAVDADVWKLVLIIDDLTTARLADSIVLAARWGFLEGQKHPLTPSAPSPSDPDDPQRGAS